MLRWILTSRQDKFDKISINQAFCINDCIYKSDDKAVLFSPFTQETLLCEVSVIDFLVHLKENSTLKTDFTRSYQDITPFLVKLISMQILQLKE